jgi:8-oxo-dGTP pyrophosphatase MutT (NUDIX family)
MMKNLVSSSTRLREDCVYSSSSATNEVLAMEKWTHAGGIVARHNGKLEFLLITTTGEADEWTFPKGHIEPNEASENAAIREVREEAGVFAEIVAFIGTTSFPKKTETVRVAYYLLHCVGRTERHENRAISWCDYEAALRKLSFEDSKEMLVSAMKQNLLMRVHPKPSG